MSNYHGSSQNASSSSSYHYGNQSRGTTVIYGLIIGVSRDEYRDFLMYSKEFDDLIRIDRRIQTRLTIGKWLEIHVNVHGFNCDLILDDRYIVGLRFIEPNGKNVSARFFPSRNSNNPEYGELLVTARFDLKKDSSGQLRYFNYDISADHFIDEYDLVKQSDRFYEGRSFIIETQAALDGFLVLQVTEDSRKLLDCESVSPNCLPDPAFPRDSMFLEDCSFFPIWTGNGDGYAPRRTSPTPIDNSSLSPPAPIPSSSPSPEALHELRSSSETELQQIATTSRNSPHTETILQDTVSSDQRVEVFEDDDFDVETTEMTLGTGCIPAKQLTGEIAKEEMKRYRTSKGMRSEEVTVLAVVVQLFPSSAFLFSTTKDVSSILVQESSCDGLDEPLRLGDVAFFEVSMTRIETRDELLPQLPFTHVASRRLPETEKSKAEIENFKSKIRCFGGLLEMKVTIQLTSPHVKVVRHYDNNPLKSESDRFYYILEAIDGTLVTIPVQRIIELLNSNHTAKFDLVAWAVHRKPIGGVALHIGEAGEAWERYPDRRIEELKRITSSYRS